jgi:hypothetical protein
MYKYVYIDRHINLFVDSYIRVHKDINSFKILTYSTSRNRQYVMDILPQGDLYEYTYIYICACIHICIHVHICIYI